MKIALVGTEGTGKTTLAKAVSEKCKIPYVDECARIVAKEMNVVPRDLDPGEMYEFQIKCLDMKIQEEQKHSEFIADRSTVDNMAYYLRWVAYYKDFESNENYIRKCINNFSNYDKVILLEPNIKLVKDEIRTDNIWYRESIHLLIKGILEEYLDYMAMPYTNLNDRINFICNLLKKEIKND